MAYPPAGSDRINASKNFAPDVLTKQKPNETFQDLYNKNKARIPKEYHEESRVFPPSVTAKDILNAPAYTIGTKTRKGGFVISAGKALDPQKVQEKRDK